VVINIEQKCTLIDRLVESPVHAPRLLRRHDQSSIRDYTVPVLSTAVALGIARLPVAHLEGAPVSLFLCAVMLSAWLGGVGPGLLAAVSPRRRSRTTS